MSARVSSLLELFFGVGKGAGLGGLAGFLDELGLDGFGFVAPGVTGVGDDVGDVLVGEGGVVFDAGHSGGGGVFLAVDSDGAGHAVEEDFGEAGWISCDPF